MKRTLAVVTVGAVLSLLAAGTAAADTTPTPTATPTPTPSPTASPTAAATMVVPTLNDDEDLYDVDYGDTVTLMGTGQPGDTIGIFFHVFGQNGYDQRRSLVVPASGQYRVTYVGTKDERYYAVDQTEATDARYASDPGLTTVEPLVSVSPTPDDDGVLTVRKGTHVTISGISTSGTGVTLTFLAGDFSADTFPQLRPTDLLQRRVPVSSPNGPFRRTFVADRDYLVGVDADNGDSVEGLEVHLAP